MSPARAILGLVIGLALLYGALGIGAMHTEARFRAHLDAAPDRSLDPLAVIAETGAKIDERVAAGEVGRLVTAFAVHLSLLHLLANAAGLALTAAFWWRVTPPAERGLSLAWLVPALVIVTSTCGFFVSFLAHMGPSAGASAGVFGLLAAVGAASWTRRAALPPGSRWVPLALVVLSGLAVVVVLGRTGMDHAAHAGGWLAGLPAGAAATRPRGRVALAALAVVALALALALVF